MIRSIEQYYVQHCNGEWEHQYGFSIESCDNPGWRIKIQDPELFMKIKKEEKQQKLPNSIDLQIEDNARFEFCLFAEKLVDLEHYVVELIRGIS